MKISHLLLLALVVFLGILVSINITGSYYVEENIADGEATTFNSGSPAGDYTNTQTLGFGAESIQQNGTFRLHWNYDFNTSLRPAELKIIERIKSDYEAYNVTIYNYVYDRWDFVHLMDERSYTIISTTLNWTDRNLTHYINQSDGQIKIAFEDINSSTQNDTLYIDYLAINVTVSPHYADWYNLSDFSSGAAMGDGTNFVRGEMLNMSAHWNASEITGAVIVLNDSNYGVEREFNISTGFATNYTNYSMNLSNTTQFPLGGNVTVRIRANDSFYQENTTAAVKWFYLLSNASVSSISINESANGSSTTIANGTTFLTLCKVADNYSSTAIPGYNVSFNFNSVFNGSNTTNSTGWAVYTYTDNSTGAGSCLVACNITSQSGIYYGPSTENATLSLTVIEDPYSPVINSVIFRYRNVTTNQTNLYANLSIIANITDNITRVNSATVNVTYPDGNITTGVMHQNSSSTDMWFIFFNTTNDDLPINITGNYTVRVTAYDTAGNTNYSADMNFTAYSTYTINMTYYYANVSYNRGENLTLSILDVNNLTVYTANWTAVNITRFSQNETNLTGDSGNTSTYFIYHALPSDPVGNYTIFANVTKSNNTGSRTFYFNMSRTLTPYFTAPDQDRQYSTSQNVNSATPVYVRVNYTRGMTANYNMSVNLSYNGNHTMVKQGASPTYYNSTMTITAPGSTGTYFRLYTYASDDNNNTGSGSLRLKTSTPSTYTPGGGGVPPARCECGNWTNAGCGPTGGCALGEMYQTRTCDPADCANTSQCIYNLICVELERGFNFTVDRTDVEVSRGENVTVIGTAENTCTISIIINLSTESELAVFALDSFNLSEAPSSLDIPITIHTALTQGLGVYFVTVSASSYGIESNKTIRVDVKENPLIERLDELETQLDSLRESIREYSDAGLYVQDLEELAGRIEELLQGANLSIQRDSLAEFRSQLELAEGNVDSANAQLSVLGIQKFIFENKWWIISGVIIIIILSYLSTEILIPYYRLSRNAKRLKTKEKTQVQGRIATEKNYFMGKMTEDAFNKILMEKQTKILDTRGAIRESIKERNELIKSKLTLGAVKNWFTSGFRRIRGKIKPYKSKETK